jgi:hypothetical protein
MSDTPRTDAAIWDEDAPAAAVGELCHELERELNRVTAERDTLKQQLDSYFADRDKSPWKSVDEPPDKRGEYLTRFKDESHSVLEYNTYRDCWIGKDDCYQHPTHWTEIPDLCL